MTFSLKVATLFQGANSKGLPVFHVRGLDDIGDRFHPVVSLPLAAGFLSPIKWIGLVRWFVAGFVAEFWAQSAGRGLEIGIFVRKRKTLLAGRASRVLGKSRFYEDRELPAVLLVKVFVVAALSALNETLGLCKGSLEYGFDATRPRLMAVTGRA